MLEQCEYLIIDEADKIIDLGFEEDLEFIMKSFPEQTEVKHRVTHMFSATMSMEVEKMAK